ncbi:MAG: glutaredoxin domain-containing protein [Verrucomicrobiota bacterium]
MDRLVLALVRFETHKVGVHERLLLTHFEIPPMKLFIVLILLAGAAAYFYLNKDDESDVVVSLPTLSVFELEDNSGRRLSCKLLDRSSDSVVVQRNADQAVFEIAFETLNVDSVQKIQESKIDLTSEEKTLLDSFYFDEAKGTLPVAMVGAKWCGYCTKAKDYFQAEDINYRYYDLDVSMTAKELMKEWGTRSVPAIKIGDRIIKGFPRDDGIRDIMVEEYKKQRQL